MERPLLVKIALILGGFFVLIILSEAAYYAYVKYFKTEPSSQNLPEGERELVFTSPSPASKRLRPETITISSAKPLLTKIDDFAETASRLPQGFYASSVISITYVGDLVEINEEKVTRNDIVYVFSLVIENEQGERLTLRLTQEELQNLKVYLVESAGNKDISYKDLRVGDDLAIINRINLLDEKTSSDAVEINVRRSPSF
ncbi:MAG: hypothetical protein ACOYT7_00310 [Patescibacteria group bacterium]